MAEFLFELVFGVIGGLVEAGGSGLCELWKKPEVKPYVDLREL